MELLLCYFYLTLSFVNLNRSKLLLAIFKTTKGSILFQTERSMIKFPKNRQNLTFNGNSNE